MDNKNFKLAINDSIEGLKLWRIWLLLSWVEIKIKYRRSVLGPFWITLSMATTIIAMGLIYSRLFHIELQTYIPHLATGLLVWSLISVILNESAAIFINSQRIILQIKLPYSFYIYKSIAKNFIMFFHHFLIFIVIVLIFKIHVNYNSLFLIISLSLLFINAYIYSMLIAMLGSRYRDIQEIIKSFVQIIFFITPIMWSAAVLSVKNKFVVELNPMASFIAIMRRPLFGELPSLYDIKMVLGCTILGLFLMFYLLIKKRKNIIYWL